MKVYLLIVANFKSYFSVENEKFVAKSTSDYSVLKSAIWLG